MNLIQAEFDKKAQHKYGQTILSQNVTQGYRYASRTLCYSYQFSLMYMTLQWLKVDKADVNESLKL